MSQFLLKGIFVLVFDYVMTLFYNCPTSISLITGQGRRKGVKHEDTSTQLFGRYVNPIPIRGVGGILCLPQRPCLLSFWGRSAVPDGILSLGNKIQSGFNAKQVYSLIKQVSLYGEVVV